MKYRDIIGLNDQQVAESREKNGSNELPPSEIESFFDKLKGNFEDPLIKILLVALAITLVLAYLGYADWVEGLGIAVAVFLATFISTYSEYKNESSFRDLQEQASKIKNTVFRNGKATHVLASEIVVGDYVLLQAGDKIPADGKLVVGEIQVNQATLNGEQEPVRKTVPPSKYTPADSSDFLDIYLCFRGSVVDEGEAVLLVEHVGESTSYGKLAAELASADERESPLQVKLSDLADGVATFGYVGATLIAISFLFKQFVLDQDWSYEKITNYLSFNNAAVVLNDVVTAIILAVVVIVVAVPEGLPMMIAIVLSLNMRKLLKAKVLVRKLLGIETAGSIDILFVDKTGTLTRGIFEPHIFIDGDTNEYFEYGLVPDKLRSILGFSLRESTSAILGSEGLIGGNASDRALLEFLDKDSIDDRDEGTKVTKEILFNSSLKFSAVQLKLGPKNPFQETSNSISIVKGAPDILISNCTHIYNKDGIKEPVDISKINEKLDQISKRGIRVIAIATSEESLEKSNQIPGNLALVGIMGIVDEIRKESKPAIELALKAGIHVVMITGDRKETAAAVAEELGLTKDKTMLTSQQLQQLSDEQIQSQLFQIGVIARALPTDKSRLVRICQELNKVVGMTGDGVNDSSALKKADVGFAMGSGSEVAKEASDIVILDDNFYSITQAVLYGRTIFKSIRKFIVFQSTVNAASLLIVFLGPFLGFDFPLTLIQLLWVNLVMDTLAALAFGGEPALKRYMSEPPIRRDEAIISKKMWSQILINGVFIAYLCINALINENVRELFQRDGKPSNEVFLTAFFAFFIFLTNFNAFNVRTNSINIFDHLFENRGFVFVVALIFLVQVTFTYVGGSILRTVGLTYSEWMSVIAVSAVIIPFDMIRKLGVKFLFSK